RTNPPPALHHHHHHQVQSSGKRSVTARKWKRHKEMLRRFDRPTKSSLTHNSFASKAVTLVTLNRGFSHKLCVARPSTDVQSGREAAKGAAKLCNRVQP